MCVQFQQLQFIELLLGLILKYLHHRKKLNLDPTVLLLGIAFGRYYFFKLL